MEQKNEGDNKAKTAEVGENSIQEDRSRSSSASSVSAESATSEFSFEDQIDKNEHGSFALDAESSEQGLLQPGTLPSDTGNNIPSSSTTLEAPPPPQVMERPADASGYRIPSYVFARNKSNTPNQEWSTASNESLFSIHTGNMSFTRDQFSWLLKSGELGMHGPGDIRKSGELSKVVADMRKSGELPPPSPKIVHKSGEQQKVPVPTPDIRKSGEQIIAAHFKQSSGIPNNKVGGADVGGTTPRASDASIPESAASVVKKEDMKVEVKNKKATKPSIDEIPLSASVSHHSDASGQSFAFPVLGEIDREKSVNSGLSRVDNQPKDSSTPDQDGQPKSPTSAPEAPAPATSWFSSCFSCCACCGDATAKPS